jgi:hypothetical protein
MLFNGKPLRIPSKEEIEELKKQARRKKRQWKREVAEEEAAEQQLPGKADKHDIRKKYKSSARLKKEADELLKKVMVQQKISVKGGDIFKALLKGKLGKKFARETRADRLKILAIGAAAYHQIACKRNPKEALHELAESVGVTINRITDPCRIIVDCLVDYGASKKERLANRQFAARDARALSHIVRTGMSPYDVMNPAKGESISKWADREAEHRSRKKAALKPAKKGPDSDGSIQPLPNQLAQVSSAQAAYDVLMGIVEQGVAVLTPKNGGEPLALAVAPLNGMSAEEAVRKPGKVRTVIRKVLRKSQLKTSKLSSAQDNSDW